ncbi:MAG TPA: hypothetical protein VIN59_08240 [Alphaproteobacteria bacterium]
MMIKTAHYAGEESPARIVAEIESLIRLEGARHYCANDSKNGFYTTQLCGVQAHLMPKSGIRRLYTPDMDLTVGEGGALHFIKGNLTALRQWHRHLIAYRKAMRSNGYAAAA